MSDTIQEAATIIIETINLTPTIERLSDQDRVQWVMALLETISEDGTIAIIRDLVDQERWDDQEPME